MATKDRALGRGSRRGTRLLQDLGGELREARIGTGLSQGAVARALGLSQPWVSRVENGEQPNLSIRDTARLASIVGLELSARVFPGGPPLRDAAHIALLERFRARLARTIRWRLEAPVPIAGDQRAIDALLSAGAERAGVEAEVRIRDVQVVLRRVNLKQRDAALPVMILLVAATNANRLAVRSAEAELRAAFPLRTREVLAEVTEGRIPHANGLVLL